MSIQHKALPNAEVDLLPQDNNINVVAVVVVCLLQNEKPFFPLCDAIIMFVDTMSVSHAT